MLNTIQLAPYSQLQRMPRSIENKILEQPQNNVSGSQIPSFPAHQALPSARLMQAYRVKFGQSDSWQQTTAKQIAEIMYTFRNRHKLVGVPAVGSDNRHIYEGYVIDKILPRIQNNEPIRLVFPGFPYKSMSRRKCLTQKVEYGEFMSLNHLRTILEAMHKAYPNPDKAPIPRLIIYTDGRPYSKASQINEGNVTQYKDGLNEILRITGGDKYICIMGLEDVLVASSQGDLAQADPQIKVVNPVTGQREKNLVHPVTGKPQPYTGDPKNFDEMRAWLMAPEHGYAPSLGELAKKISVIKDLELIDKFNGMQKFRATDLSGRQEAAQTDPFIDDQIEVMTPQFKNPDHPIKVVGYKNIRDLSPKELQETAKCMALRGLQCAEAWGQLIEQLEGKTKSKNSDWQSIRLSIHAKGLSPDKFSISLTESRYNANTPWHSSACMDPVTKKIYLITRELAEKHDMKVEYFPVSDTLKLPYYVIPDAIAQDPLQMKDLCLQMEVPFPEEILHTLPFEERLDMYRRLLMEPDLMTQAEFDERLGKDMSALLPGHQVPVMGGLFYVTIPTEGGDAAAPVRLTRASSLKEDIG